MAHMKVVCLGILWAAVIACICADALESGNEDVRTLVVGECSQYFVFQAMGVIYSHAKSGQPGPLTLILSCNPAQRKSVPAELRELTTVHFAPSFAVHPVTGDIYGAYNKPVAVLDYLTNNSPPEDFLLVMDADMILRRPLVPVEMGARLGKPISARYGYLTGVNNALAKKHIPNVEPRNDTEGGIEGRMADQV